ncbi:winged helix-turn-helix transcriptional regulator [Granulicoccus phenolivorans]|uniref:winged helix-turn-helix transcriptional regulator n=1 Tax=Granulicoccus phenolivorans TaxID=266854 RepID=UPI00042A2CD2|nr:helix-turn-helix domain-containing protein [Granulicoccus phenolivorans]
MMRESRRYDDACGVARALDAVGERWALLVVRELSLGARRFGELRSGLPGISPNVLSQRLRELEAAGLLRRYELDPPANTTVYELTEAGLGLDPVLQALGRWGATRPVTTDRPLGTIPFLRSLRVLVVPEAPDTEFGLEIGAEQYVVRIAGGVGQVARGRTEEVPVTLVGDVPTLQQALLGGAGLTGLIAADRLQVRGDRARAERLLRLFRLPG